MPLAFYSLGGVLAGIGSIWWLYEFILVVHSGRFAALVPITIGTAYVALIGALFVGIGAIIRRLDQLVANGQPRRRAKRPDQDEDAPRVGRPVAPSQRRSPLDRHLR